MGVKLKVIEDKGRFIFINHHGVRRALKAPDNPRAAETMRQQIDAKLKLGDLSILHAPVEAKISTFPRLREALPEWITKQEQRGEIRGSTPYNYRGAVDGWVFGHRLPDGRLLGDLPVDQVKREMLGAVVLRVKEAGRSIALIRHLRNPLKKFYDELRETGVLTGENPAADLKFFIGRIKRSAKVDYFTHEEGRVLMEAARTLEPRDAAFILAALLSGLRWGEIAALRKTDVDQDKGRLHVRRAYSTKARRMQPCPKNARERDVVASPALLTALKSQIETVTVDGSIKGWNVEQRELLFTSETGRVLHYDAFAERWRRLLKRAGLRYRSFHVCRHTFATWNLEEGADLRWVSAQLGHASVKTTLDTYGHLMPELHKGQAAKLDKYVC
jgi:integrase